MLIDVFAALLFIASAGLLFSERFRNNWPVVALAACLALVSTYFLTKQIVDDAVDQRFSLNVKLPQPGSAATVQCKEDGGAAPGQVLRTATFDARIGDLVNLDLGCIYSSEIGNNNADFVFGVENDKADFNSQSGAEFVNMGGDEPGYQGCLNATFNGDQNLDDIPIGAWICSRRQWGHSLSEVHLNYVLPDQKGVNVTSTSWRTP